MKYFFLFLILLAAIGYTFYYGGDDSVWTDADLETLVMQKNEDLCLMPEFLEEYKINQAECQEIFISKIDYCLEQTEQSYPGEEFESKQQFLDAFNEALSCIALNMKN
jgi:hypothetical protein